MGKFKSSRIIIRQLETIDIYFLHANSIYVFYKDTNEGAVFHNWFEYGKYLSNWEPFRVKMLRYRNLTMARCYELADYHDVAHSSMGRRLELNDKTVDLRAQNFRVLGVLKEWERKK